MTKKTKVFASVLLGLSLAAAAAVASATPTALSAGLDLLADCTSNARLQVSWTGVGDPTNESGVVTNTAGTIGGFPPQVFTGSNNYTGTYGNPITTPQPPGTFIGSYAVVGADPPTAAGSIEFMVLYNCASKQVLYACFGPYGKCANTAAAALATTAIPTTSRETLAALVLLLAVLGALFLRRRASQRS